MSEVTALLGIEVAYGLLHPGLVILVRLSVINPSMITTVPRIMWSSMLSASSMPYRLPGCVIATDESYFHVYFQGSKFCISAGGSGVTFQAARMLVWFLEVLLYANKAAMMVASVLDFGIALAIRSCSLHLGQMPGTRL